MRISISTTICKNLISNCISRIQILLVYKLEFQVLPVKVQNSKLEFEIPPVEVIIPSSTGRILNFTGRTFFDFYQFFIHTKYIYKNSSHYISHTS